MLSKSKLSMVNILSIYREVSLNLFMRSNRLDFWRLAIQFLSLQYRNKSVISGAQFVLIGIPTTRMPCHEIDHIQFP